MKLIWGIIIIVLERNENWKQYYPHSKDAIVISLTSDRESNTTIFTCLIDGYWRVDEPTSEVG